MVIGQIMPTNPAAGVRGPRHIVRRGKTPVLDPAEARQLIDAIDTTTVIGLRDRALIGLMVYSFARIGAAIGMRVEDVYTQNRRLWVRLHEKGGKQHAMPCHHNLESYLHAYIDGAGLARDPKALLFQTYSGATGRLTGNPLPQANAYAMIRRRARAAEITTKDTPHNKCYGSGWPGLDRVVPFRMELIAGDVEALHCGIADFDAPLIAARVERALAPINSTTARRSVSGRPRQFCVIWQNRRCSILFHFDVPGG